MNRKEARPRPERSGFRWVLELFRIALPLALIPIVFAFLFPFGHDVINLFIGAVLFYVFLFQADQRARRLIVILSVFAGIFEIANVASGFYSYAGHPLVPLWVAMGWAVLGWYAVWLVPVFRKIPDWLAFSASTLAILSVSLAYHYWALSMLFAAVGVVLLSKTSTRFPAAFFAFGAIIGLVLEVAGTSLGVWRYTTASGALAIPEFGQLSIGYAMVLAFATWAAGYDSLTKKIGRI